MSAHGIPGDFECALDQLSHIAPFQGRFNHLGLEPGHLQQAVHQTLQAFGRGIDLGHIRIGCGIAHALNGGPDDCQRGFQLVRHAV